MNPVKSNIIGTWKLVSIFYKKPDGEKVDMYGKNPNGILMYDQYGYMNAQIGFSNRNDHKDKSEDQKKIYSFDTYISYYGKYNEKEPGVLVHEVEGCLKPDWEGSSEIRYITINANDMYITTPETNIDGISTKIEVYWKRVN